MTRCATLCARAEHSKFEIRRKLKQWGADAEMTDIVLSRLEKNGFLDDERFAMAYTNDKLNFDRWGRVKIRYMLHQHDIEDKAIDKAIESIDEDEYMEIMRSLLADKSRMLRGDDAFKRKASLYRYAVARGYEPYIVSKELGKLPFCEVEEEMP